MIEKNDRLVFVGNTQIGLMGLKELLPPPALIINKKVQTNFNLPPKSMVKRWLEEKKADDCKTC
jgi:hypothetical protein